MDDAGPFYFIFYTKTKKPSRIQTYQRFSTFEMDFFQVLNNLPNKLLNLTVVQLPKRKQFSLKDVSAHCTETDCWMVIRDRVYDLTNFLREHPAGSDIMLEYAGTDATMAFADKPHSLDAWLMLEKYLVGELIAEERMFDDDYSS